MVLFVHTKSNKGGTINKGNTKTSSLFPDPPFILKYTRPNAAQEDRLVDRSDRSRFPCLECTFGALQRNRTRANQEISPCETRH
jgi:hypothetical protein